MYNKIQSADGEVASSVNFAKQFLLLCLSGTILFKLFKLLQMMCKLGMSQKQKFDSQHQY